MIPLAPHFRVENGRGRLAVLLTVCSPQIYAYDISKILLGALRPQWFLILCVGVTQESERADEEAEEDEDGGP